MGYYTNIKLTLESENILEYPRKENISLLYQDEIFQYSFISKNKINENSYIAFSADDISDKKFINQKFKVSDILFSIPDGNEINSVIAGLELKNIDLEENTSVQISKKYQILCKYTSFFMEIENENSNELGLKKVILPVVQQKKFNNFEEEVEEDDCLGFGDLFGGGDSVRYIDASFSMESENIFDS